MTLPEHTNPPGKSNATASLVLGIIAAKIEKALKKVVPDVLDLIVTPFVTLLCSMVIGLIRHFRNRRPDPGQQGQGTGIPGRHPHGGICALPHWSDRRRPGLCGLCRLRQLCGDRQHPSPVIPSTYAAAFLPRRLILELSLRLCYPIGILAALSSPRTAC